MIIVTGDFWIGVMALQLSSGFIGTLERFKLPVLGHRIEQQTMRIE